MSAAEPVQSGGQSVEQLASGAMSSADDKTMADDNCDAGAAEVGAANSSTGDGNSDEPAKKGKKEKTKKSKQEKKAKNKQQLQQENKCTNNKKQKSTKETNLVSGNNSVSGAKAAKAADKPKQLMVDELKLFQNNNLLNQQDPMQNLHIQLSQFINSSSDSSHQHIAKQNGHHQLASALASSTAAAAPNDNIINHRSDRVLLSGDSYSNGLATLEQVGDTCSTIKKGVLWQQQSYDKFHQRLFNRWKKRYFILTTDYLVCFKRSLPKVGRSEMGKFLYKTSLGDMLKVDWLKPTKSDKGSIVLHLSGQFNLHLWTKDNLDEWMFMIRESIVRYQARRCYSASATTTADLQGQSDAVYENTNPQIRSHANSNSNGVELRPPTSSIESRRQEVSRADRSAASAEPNQADKNPSTSGDSEPVINDADGHSTSGTGTKTDEAERRSSTERHEKTPGQCAIKNDEQREQSNLSSVGAAAAAARSRSSFRRRASSKDNNEDADGELVSSREPRQSSLVEKRQLCGQTTSTGNASANTNQTSGGGGGNTKEDTNQAPPAHKAAPATNLIRRDDSWQSLVSLTRVGRAPPTASQVAQRSLYAQHIMPHSVDVPLAPDHGPTRLLPPPPHSVAATPVRAPNPLGRHHSIQSQQQQQPPRGKPSLRAVHALANQRAAASFDSPARPLPASVSYQQKLLQLQLLHNSNNVDYIRQSGTGDGGGGDYAGSQIYSGAPESTVYGYSSMRSNLKSATSEFSFIRPASSGLAHILQSTLPHQNSAHVLAKARDSFRAANQLVGDARDINNNENENILVDPTSGGDIPLGAYLFQQQQQQQLELPMRELPLKPNKKRSNREQVVTSGDCGGEPKSLPKSSSLTSSIACFFKRAFSRRSKRRPHRGAHKASNRLQAESCSSSLGAFESENFARVPMLTAGAPSAFSTGSKSVDGRHQLNEQQQHSMRHMQQQQQQPQPQPQRMVDMIEAFTSKNFCPATEHDATPARMNRHRQQQQQSQASPLHKSNSISATMGLMNQRASFVSHFDHMANRHGQRPGGSPVLPRSAKVLSANLTPLRDPTMMAGGNQSSSMHHHRLSVLSPLNHRQLQLQQQHHHQQMPRPSSIYGQPSMIGGGHGSPVVGRVSASEFGARGGQQVLPLIGNHHLGTTREEDATELLGAAGQYDNNIRTSHIINGGGGGHYMSRAEANNRPTPQHRRAVVNPILQSPTMDTIYDNHQPSSHMMMGDYASHYDNHQATPNPCSPQVQATAAARRLASSSMVQFYPPQSAAETIMQENPYSSRQQQRMTPSHNSSGLHRILPPMASGGGKPAAIVAPSTPNRQTNDNSNNSYLVDHNHPLQPQRHLATNLDRNKSNRNPIYSAGLHSVAVNIAGAPGINLDPALAASLLQGTNISAYESPFGSHHQNGGQNGAYAGSDNSKTFLVSTRLSKSMAQQQQRSSPSSSQSTSSSLSSSSLMRRATGSGAGDTFRRESGSSRSKAALEEQRHRPTPRAKLEACSSSNGSSGQEKEKDENEAGDSSSMESHRRIGPTGRRRTSAGADDDDAGERRNSSTGSSSCSSSAGSKRPSNNTNNNSNWNSSERDSDAECLGKSAESEQNWISSKLMERSLQQ